MKNLFSIGKLALLGVVLSAVGPVFGQWAGSLDGASCTTISGWVANTTSLNTSYSVDIYDGSSLVTSVVASTFRQDLVNAGYGNGNHGFSISTPSSLLNGAAHSIMATPHGVALGVANLAGSPKSITCGGTAHNYGGSLDGAGCATIGGWAWDADNPNVALTMVVWVDGAATSSTATANQLRQDVKNAGIGTGLYGYTIATPSIVQNGQSHSVSVRPAGATTEVLAGSPQTVSCSAHLYTGWLDGADCTSIRGWAADLDNENVPQTVTLYVDGVATTTTQVANIYRADVKAAIGGGGAYGFSITPPASLSDGLQHKITVGFGSPVAFLASSVPYTFSCDANGIEGFDESGQGACSGADVTISATPTLTTAPPTPTTKGTTTTYAAGTVSGFYLTNPGDSSTTGDSLTTNVQGVVYAYTGSVTLWGAVGYYAPATNNTNPNPFADSQAPGNGLFGFNTGTGFNWTMTFNMGSSMAGNFYFGGQATLTTCVGTIGPMGYVAFQIHVTAKPTITSAVSYPTVDGSGPPGPLIVGQPGTVVINGTNLGDAGTVTFTAPNGSTFSETYNGYNQSQATVGALTGVAGTYTLSLQETADVTGFTFQQTGAQGQEPKSGTAQVQAVNNPGPTLSMSTNLWFFGTGNTPPPSFTLGNIQTTVTASGASGGSFAWTIAAGNSEASFASGTGQNTTKTIANSVTIYSISYGLQLNDVTVSVIWTDTNGVAHSPSTLNLTIDSPFKLILYSSTPAIAVADCSVHSTVNPVGWWAQYQWQMISKFGQTIVGQSGNESFGTPTDYQANNWPFIPNGFAGSSGADLITDNYCLASPTAYTPPSQVPQSPPTANPVDSAPQSYYIGSATVGSGVQVQTQTLNRYTDHANVTSVVSPVRTQ